MTSVVAQTHNFSDMRLSSCYRIDMIVGTDLMNEVSDCLFEKDLNDISWMVFWDIRLMTIKALEK